MENYNRMMAKMMADLGSKVITGNVFGNVSPDIEWIKWLNYEPEFEIDRINYLENEKVSDLSIKDLEEIIRYRRNREFAKLFKQYGTGEISKEDYMRVYDFMSNESIDDLMLSKLTSEELRYAKQEITKLSNISKEELSKKVHEEQKEEVYKKLSMVDSYVLHQVSNINYARSLNELNRKIDAQLKANEEMRFKSLHYAAK